MRLKLFHGQPIPANNEGNRWKSGLTHPAVSSNAKFGRDREKSVVTAIMNATLLFSLYIFPSLFVSLSLSLSPLAAFLLREGEFCQASCWKFNHPRKRAMIVPRHVTRASLFCIHGCRKREREGERERNREKWGTKRERIQLKGEKQEVLNKTYGVSNKFVEKRRD